MSQTGNPPGAMVDSAMPAGGGAEDVLIEAEAQSPGITDEILEELIVEAGEGDTLDPEEALQEIGHTSNLAESLDERVLEGIAGELVDAFEDDLDSRDEWEQALSKGLGLLGINYEERDEPFSGASGVTHPLISESVTQFQAQAYKEILPSAGPVRTQIVGAHTAESEDQAKRVEDFMNYYIMEVMEEYDLDTDQMLFYLPLAGSTFKKVYFDPIKGRAVAKFLPAEDVVVPYSATDIRTAERITHVLRTSENDLRKMQVGGIYRDVEISASQLDSDSDELKDRVNEISGVRPSYQDTGYTLLEIHTYLDLEGFEDVDDAGEPTGVKLPYAVTLDRDSNKVLAIYRNYEEEDESRAALQHFVHYKFLPGFGFYGFGLIHMIGGLSRAATSILRQLIDAGTLSNLPAGFKARGVRIRNDDEPLQPGEFRDIDAPGGDIRNAISPLPYKEPSGTLSQLLGVIIDSGRRYASIADNSTGDMNSNAPVGTTVALLERGSRVMSAIHKRMHYAQKQEFKLLSAIIGDTVEMYPYQLRVPAQVAAQDFDGRVDIIPVSDPNIFSAAQRQALAQTQLQMAMQSPEIHDLREAYRRMYAALEVKNIDELLPKKPDPQPMDPASEIAKLFSGQDFRAFPQQNQEAHITAYVSMLQTPIMREVAPVKGALISKLFERIGYLAQQTAVQQIQAQAQQQMQQAMATITDPAMAQQLQMQIQAQAQQQLAVLVPQITAQLVAQYAPGISPPESPDPLVGIRQAEVQIAAADQQRRTQKDQTDAALETARIQQSAQQAEDRLDTQVEIAAKRDATNRERIQTQEEIAVMRELNKG
jgi:hypothetical protein